MSNEAPSNQLQIEVDDSTAQGVYSNLAVITHAESEMVLDFVYLQPQVPKARVRARVLTSPVHAKKFLLALQDNIQKYEARFGKIEVSGPPDQGPRVGFYH